MTAEELMTIANMGKGTDMSSYEHFMMAEKSGATYEYADYYFRVDSGFDPYPNTG